MMLTLLVYIIFIFSVAFTASGVVLSTRLRNKYGSDIFSTLLYYQVFIFAFGFYGIWGQIVIKSFLSGIVSADLLNRFTNISILLGIPFLLFAWLMLIRFSREISGRKRSNWFVLWFLVFNFLILFGLGLLIRADTSIRPEKIIQYYFISLSFIYTMVSSVLVIIPGKGRTVIRRSERRIISMALLLITTLQCLSLFFYDDHRVAGLAFIFLFFAGNSFLPLYLSYSIVLSVFTETPGKDLSFEDFCKKFEISPRESDIIREICNGLTNQEISDKLFISLQTVKDHSHRIYIKTNAKNRVQLINLVKDVKERRYVINPQEPGKQAP
jgi:DNA-binding CsgD family transcriptional regulator